MPLICLQVINSQAFWQRKEEKPVTGLTDGISPLKVMAGPFKGGRVNTAQDSVPPRPSGEMAFVADAKPDDSPTRIRRRKLLISSAICVQAIALMNGAFVYFITIHHELGPYKLMGGLLAGLVLIAGAASLVTHILILQSLWKDT